MPSELSREVPDPKAVIFDAVGTLIRLTEAVGVVYSRLAAEFGVSVSPPQLDAAFSRVFQVAPPMAFPGRDEPTSARLERDWWRSRVRDTFRAADQLQHFADFDGFFGALWRHFAEPRAWELVPGAERTLACLAGRRIRLAMLSNFDLRLPVILRALGLETFFEIVLLPGHCGFAKPDPRFFAEICSRLECPPGRCVYVGDDPVQDVAGAQAAGLQAIDVRSLATLGELEDRLGGSP